KGQASDDAAGRQRLDVLVVGPIIDIGIESIDTGVEVLAPGEIVVLDSVAEQRSLPETSHRGAPLDRAGLVAASRIAQGKPLHHHRQMSGDRRAWKKSHGCRKRKDDDGRARRYGKRDPLSSRRCRYHRVSSGTDNRAEHETN